MKIDGMSINVGRALVEPTVSALLYGPSQCVFQDQEMPVLSNGHWMLFGPALRSKTPVGYLPGLLPVVEAAVRKAGASGLQGCWRYSISNDTLDANCELPAFDQAPPKQGHYAEVELSICRVDFGTGRVKADATSGQRTCDWRPVTGSLSVQDPIPDDTPVELLPRVSLDLSYVLAFLKLDLRVWCGWEGSGSFDELAPLLVTTTGDPIPVGIVMPCRLA